MWSDESRFTLFQSDGCVMVRSESDEVMQPTYLVFTAQACGGSIHFVSYFRFSHSLKFKFK